MANNGPNTNGSQFFFSYGEQPHLDLKYTLFGRLVFFIYQFSVNACYIMQDPLEYMAVAREGTG